MPHKSDYSMALALLIIIVMPYAFEYIGIHAVFTFWHYVAFSGGYGAYVTLRAFVFTLQVSAKRLGMEKELERIFEMPKKEKRAI